MTRRHHQGARRTTRRMEHEQKKERISHNTPRPPNVLVSSPMKPEYSLPISRQTQKVHVQYSCIHVHERSKADVCLLYLKMRLKKTKKREKYFIPLQHNEQRRNGEAGRGRGREKMRVGYQHHIHRAWGLTVVGHWLPAFILSSQRQLHGCALCATATECKKGLDSGDPEQQAAPSAGAATAAASGAAFQAARSFRDFPSLRPTAAGAKGVW